MAFESAAEARASGFTTRDMAWAILDYFDTDASGTLDTEELREFVAFMLDYEGAADVDDDELEEKLAGMMPAEMIEDLKAVSEAHGGL